MFLRHVLNFRRRGSETENLEEEANGENISPTTIPRTTIVHFQGGNTENGNTQGMISTIELKLGLNEILS